MPISTSTAPRWWHEHRFCPDPERQAGRRTSDQNSAGPRYSLLLSTDPSLIEAAQRLRYDVFTSTPGFTLPAVLATGTRS